MELLPTAAGSLLICRWGHLQLRQVCAFYTVHVHSWCVLSLWGLKQLCSLSHLWSKSMLLGGHQHKIECRYVIACHTFKTRQTNNTTTTPPEKKPKHLKYLPVLSSVLSSSLPVSWMPFGLDMLIAFLFKISGVLVWFFVAAAVVLGFFPRHAVDFSILLPIQPFKTRK